LPVEYARIFQFDDLRRTYKKVVRETIDGAQVIEEEEKKTSENKLKLIFHLINSLIIGRKQ
jgi:hypothetical protein